MDLEALAHAARDTLDRLPYMPRSSGSEGPELEVRLNYGRLQTLVSATAASARDVLLACDQMLEESDEPPDDDGGDGGPEEPPDDGGDDDGGPGDPPASSGNGEPNVSGPGYLPQAQAQYGVVEASVDDIDEGAGKPPAVTGGGAPGVLCMPRTRPSRGGIMLDVAVGLPELVPLVPAGSAYVALQSTALA
ncbi:MAG TPA: hypothetical protein VNM90_04150 [Haliangium sp.]|nr:hypothetical protein [Haliangium sp.]